MRRTTETSLASGIVPLLPQMSILIRLSPSTSMWAFRSFYFNLFRISVFHTITWSHPSYKSFHKLQTHDTHERPSELHRFASVSLKLFSSTLFRTWFEIRGFQDQMEVIFKIKYYYFLIYYIHVCLCPSVCLCLSLELSQIYVSGVQYIMETFEKMLNFL